MKRVLIVSYYWPPSGGSGVQRWVKFCKYLPSLGWQPVVCTPENPEELARDESLASEVPPEVEVLRRRIVEPYGIYRALASPGRRSRSSATSEVNPINGGRKGFFKRMAVALRGNLFIPDPRVGWVRPSVRFLRKYLREHPVDAVVTTGPPQSMHLIGLALKRALGLRWIADFRDPWTEMFYYKHLGLSRLADRRHHVLERRVLDAADVIVAVSPPVRDDFAAKTSTPVVLVTNGFDDADFAAISGRLEETETSLRSSLPQAAPAGPSHSRNHGRLRFPAPPACRTDDGGRFRIVHTGLFAADGNPLNLWQALAEMCSSDADFASRLEIRLAGKTDPEIVAAIRAAGLGGNLTDLGYLPHDEVTREQMSADVLILPLRREPEYAKVLPGKIFEYLAARRPVLGIGQEEGAAAAVLRDAGAGVMYEWDKVEELKAFISCPPEPSGDISAYSRRALAERMARVLEGEVL